MSNAVMTIRMDYDIKRSFESLCGTVGMTVNTAINVFVREAIRNQRLNLSLSAVPCAPAYVSAQEARAIAESLILKGGRPVPADETGTRDPKDFAQSEIPVMAPGKLPL